MPTGAEPSRPDEQPLRRTLGLFAASAIGLGTMVGAGVFVFPGLAGARAGPAATISFALAGAIALVVALATAELATAMPRSGGAYRYLTRAFGPFVGAAAGFAQIVGLCFASAFYLVAFGRYAEDMGSGWGLEIPAQPWWLPAGAALFLTALNLIGARQVGRAQSYAVAAMAFVLTIFFGFAALEVGATPAAGRSFLPNGLGSAVASTALVFTAYLGFVQIATVSGELRRPARNLPRAIVGSVLAATLLYLLVVGVTTALLPPERLAELGETATVEVGRSVAGRRGVVVILAAALLATLSSANASVLAASRTSFAMSREALLPAALGRVRGPARTPSVAVCTVGFTVAALVFANRIELLAEVASLIFLVLYAGICASVVALRGGGGSHDFRPSFSAPVPSFAFGLGAASCLVVLAWIDPLALVVGTVALALCAFAAWPASRSAQLAPGEPDRSEPVDP